MRKYFIVGGVSLASMAIGAGVSYLITKKAIETKYEAILKEEARQSKAFYTRLTKKEGFSTPQTALAFYKEKVADYSARLEMEQGITDEEYLMEHHSIDIGEGGPLDGWNEEEELESRSDDAPYIISKHEYHNTNPDYVKADYTYYEVDDIIIDGGTVPIPNVDSLLGEENLKKFGHGSGHKDKVYIRNEELETDFEIDRTQGDFSEEVLGYIEHSSGPGKVLKFHREEE